MSGIKRPVEPAGASARSHRPIRVVIADDEGMFRTCLRQLLAAPTSVIKDVYGCDVGPGFEVIGEATTGHGAVETVRSMQPDLLLLDIAMPRMSGLDALRELQRSRSAVRTIVLSGVLDKIQLLTAIQLGACGLVSKASATEELFEAIVSVMAGRSWIAPALVTSLMDVLRTGVDVAPAGAQSRPFGLTPREREVLELALADTRNDLIN